MFMQNIGIHSIEDCLEILTGLQKHNLKFQIKTSDATIINSIARQVNKGTALTDRQYNSMKLKLVDYKEQFENNNIIGFDGALSKLRNPLREIDRSKYISIVESPNDVIFPSNIVGNFIKIKFPFSKSLIVKVESISNKHKNLYYHQKGSHEHFFVITENVIFDVVSTFQKSDFKIEELLIESYNKIVEIKNAKEQYVPGIYAMQFKNIHAKAEKLIEGNLGVITQDSLIKFADRRRRYGYEVFDNIDCDDNVLYNIVNRDDMIFHSKPSEHSITDIVSKIEILDRFPLLVIIDERNAEQNLEQCFESFDIDPKQQTCLFRLEGEQKFNQLIKQYDFNNWLDNSIKIVYISNRKIPKLLVKETWRPIATLAFTSGMDRQVSTFVHDTSDLIIFREEELSPFRLKSSYYANY